MRITYGDIKVEPGVFEGPGFYKRVDSDKGLWYIIGETESGWKGFCVRSPSTLTPGTRLSDIIGREKLIYIREPFTIQQ